MTTCTLQYLLQTDPSSGPPSDIGGSDTYTFDLRRVGAVAMRELVQTCRAGNHMTSIILALLSSAPGRPLVWRGDGPGVGWEMKSAWSGLFGRFFARAYLEDQGYSWFHPIQRSYDRVTDDMVVVRVGTGEIADWVCAKADPTTHHVEIALAEAKGRHREGNHKLDQLPRPLEKALQQIENTVVQIRDSIGDFYPRSAKGYAILTKWTNQTKGPRSKALLRVVDPDTPGAKFKDAERRSTESGLAKSHVSRLLRGLGYEGLAYETSPLKEPLNLADATRSLNSVGAILASRSGRYERSPERAWTTRKEFERRRIEPDQAERLEKAVEREIKAIEREREREQPQWQNTDRLKEEAKQPVSAVFLKEGPLTNTAFVGNFIGISGPVPMNPNEALKYISGLPDDLARQFMFVGAREKLVRSVLSETKFMTSDFGSAAAGSLADDVHLFSDGSIIASAIHLKPGRQIEFR